MSYSAQDMQNAMINGQTGQNAYQSVSSTPSYFTTDDGQLSNVSVALIFGILFLIIASPQVYSFTGGNLNKFISSVNWYTPGQPVSTQLVIVHSVVFAVLAYILLNLTNAQ